MVKKKKRKLPVPKRKWCQNCEKHRVKFHHYLCENCWKLIHKSREEIREEDIKEF
jgi:hypothetical protein